MNVHPFLAGFLGLGAPELLIILVILLVLFGGAKLPSLARNLGSSIKEFKKAAKEGAEEDEKSEETKKDASKADDSKKSTGKN
jgi:sec-independent protein translocase protein TatA